jgi:predicted nucleotidyltransferase
MRTDLDHLPLSKRRELERIVEILFAEFEEATALGTQEWKKRGRILKIILFGSFARGDWVADPEGGYFSDFDLLVVVNDRRLTDTLEFWAKADDRLTRAVTIENRFRLPQISSSMIWSISTISSGTAGLSSSISPATGSRCTNWTAVNSISRAIFRGQSGKRKRSAISINGFQAPRRSRKAQPTTLA